MAGRGNSIGIFIWLSVIAIVIISFFKIRSSIRKNINESIETKAKALSEIMFVRRQSELNAQIEQQKLAVLKEVDEKAALLHQEAADRKNELDRIQEQRTIEYKCREEYLAGLRSAFEGNFIYGRKWLSRFVAEADKALDDQLCEYLTAKKHPAVSAAEIVRQAKDEKRQILMAAKFLQYQLASYKEYFPILEEYEEAILNERINLLDTENPEETIDQVDRVILFVNKDEYDRLSSVERNQLALDRYLLRNKERWEIGRLYERFLGYQYEIDGWNVDYFGALKGFEDMGRDLICRRNGDIHIVQAKCWSSDKTIHEKHVFNSSERHWRTKSRTTFRPAQ